MVRKKGTKMKELILNETPVRTSRNFKINNIKIEDVALPEKIEAFQNVEVISKKSKIDEKVSNMPLTFGTGEVLEENVAQYANNSLRIITGKDKENIKITYKFDDNNLTLINNIEIIAEEDSNIVIYYKSYTDKPCFHNGIIRLIAKENAKVNMTVINLLNNKSSNFEAIESGLENNSYVDENIIDIGGKTSITNNYSNIIGENAKSNLKTIYLGIDNQIKDLNYIAELRGKKSEIDIDVQGALKDSSKKNFKGTIDFKKGSKKAKGNENEYCMLLSDKAKSIALPMLLCEEDDVEGNHGVASGKVDEQVLFYIMSRGIEYKEAIKLIVRARFHKIIEKIQDETLESEILQEIDRRLDK